MKPTKLVSLLLMHCDWAAAVDTIVQAVCLQTNLYIYIYISDDAYMSSKRNESYTTFAQPERIAKHVVDLLCSLFLWVPTSGCQTTKCIVYSAMSMYQCVLILHLPVRTQRRLLAESLIKYYGSLHICMTTNVTVFYVSITSSSVLILFFCFFDWVFDEEYTRTVKHS